MGNRGDDAGDTSFFEDRVVVGGREILFGFFPPLFSLLPFSLLDSSFSRSSLFLYFFFSLILFFLSIIRSVRVFLFLVVSGSTRRARIELCKG